MKLSFWMKLGLTITNLECFRAMCEKHKVEYVANQDPNFLWQGEKVAATLKDSVGGRGYAFLVESKGGFRMAWDSDARYNPLAGRIGANGGVLTRDYSTEMVGRGITKNGGLVTSTREQADGSIILKAAVGGM